MIFLSLGSNLKSPDGNFNRFENIDSAIKTLISYGYSVIKKSSYYETPSYPDKEKPKFINVVIEIFTNLSFGDLVSILISIEETLEIVWQKINYQL